MLHAVLLQDGGQIALGYIVLESTVTENGCGLGRRTLLLAPLSHAQSQGLCICRADVFVQAGQQSACTDAVYGLACDLLLFDGNAEVQA